LLRKQHTKALKKRIKRTDALVKWVQVGMGFFLKFLALSLLFSVSGLFAGESTEISPKILFHGGGGGAPKWATDMSSAADQLKRLGFPKEHIFKVNYPAQKNISDIVAVLEPQLKGFMGRYSSDTEFDVVGHSLGHAVSLVTMARLGLLSKVRKLIGIAGVMFGQLGEKPGLCRLTFLASRYCGDIFDLLIGTTRPLLIEDIIEKNPEEMERIQKCSLFSPDDGRLVPFDSGAFQDGINISLPNVKHLQFKSSSQVFDTMKQECFGGEL